MRKPPGRAYQDLVATIAKAFDSTAAVEAGKWVEGPDGRLDMDVSIEGRMNGRSVRIVIECKDFDLRKTGPVGRPIVDALDSKRHDLNVDAAFICSNSGFTEDALRKARRKGIGMISVLAKGDNRVKAVIESEIYFRKVTISPNINFNYNSSQGLPLKDTALHGAAFHHLTYNGLSVNAWMYYRVPMIIAANRALSSGPITVSFKFKAPTALCCGIEKIVLDNISISVSIEIRWFSQTVRLNASLGMYDYLRQRVRLPRGQHQYLIENVDFDKGTPLPSAPEIENVGVNLLTGEFDVYMVMMEGVDDTILRIPMPSLEEIIIPEDLNVKIPDDVT
jgi:hypothetical protein